MSILLNNHGYDNQSWYQELSRHFPEKSIHIYSEMDDIHSIEEDIEYAVIWNHPQGDLIRYPNLKGILLLGAGTEHIDAEPNLPDVPIVRLVDPEVLKDMGLYVLYWVMNAHRLYRQYAQQQKERVWQRHNISQTTDFHVTVLGLGAVGKTVASCLVKNGFRVSGWDAKPQAVAKPQELANRQEPQELEGVSTFSSDELDKALENANTLVNCLPLTQTTKGFINHDVLSMLPKGAQLINISRGEIVDDDALLQAIDAQRIHHAVLDTFAIEPLPSSSPYWQHPNVTVTPHISGATYARSAAALIAANIQRIEQGETPFPLHHYRSPH